MTRDELANICVQFRDAPVQRGDSAQLAVETFNGWLERQRERLRLAVLLQGRGEAVPRCLADELRRAAATTEARRALLRKVYGSEF